MSAAAKQCFLSLMLLVMICLSAMAVQADETGSLLFSVLTPYRDDMTSFGFELRLGEEINGRFGDLTFLNGVAAFTLSQGQRVRAGGLPADTPFTLKSLRNTGYTARYYNLDGYAVTNPRGRIESDKESGIVIAEIQQASGDTAIFQTDLTDVMKGISGAFYLPGDPDTDAGQTKLALWDDSGRVFAGPLTVRASTFLEYGIKGRKVYRYLIPTADGKEWALEVTAVLSPGQSLKTDDDVLQAEVSLYRGNEKLAFKSLEGKGRFATAFTSKGGRFTAAGSNGGAEYAIKGDVLLIGRAQEAEEFSFSVEENGVVVASAKNKADGTLSFTPIVYSDDDLGGHAYRIIQNEGDAGDIYYDPSEYTVGVFVTRNGNRLEANLTSINKDGNPVSQILFQNKFALTDFKVYNLWQGGNEGTIELILFANGERLKKQPKYSIEGAAYTFSDLPMFDEHGKKILYSARELYVAEYMAIYVNTGEYSARTKMLYNGGTVINRKVMDFAFMLLYTQPSGQEKKDIVFTLYCNGVPYYTQTQPVKDEYGRYVYRHLPVKVNGETAVYSVKVNAEPGLIVVYENEGVRMASQEDGVPYGGRVVAWRVPDTGDHSSVCFLILAASLIGLAAITKRRGPG